MDVEIGKHPQSFCYVMSVNANQRVMQLCVIQQCVMCCGLPAAAYLMCCTFSEHRRVVPLLCCEAPMRRKWGRPNNSVPHSDHHTDVHCVLRQLSVECLLLHR